MSVICVFFFKITNVINFKWSLCVCKMICLNINTRYKTFILQHSQVNMSRYDINWTNNQSVDSWLQKKVTAVTCGGKSDMNIFSDDSTACWNCRRVFYSSICFHSLIRCWKAGSRWRWFVFQCCRLRRRLSDCPWRTRAKPSVPLSAVRPHRRTATGTQRSQLHHITNERRNHTSLSPFWCRILTGIRKQ